jgi:hypothetical protein
MKTDQAQFDTAHKFRSGTGTESVETQFSRRRRQMLQRDLAGHLATASPETESRSISSCAPPSVVAVAAPKK